MRNVSKRLEDIVFSPFESSNDGEADDLDPDSNFFHSVSNINCKYYNEDEFKNIPKTGINQGSLSLLHHNIRSLAKNCDQLQTYVSTLDFSFTVIGLKLG